MTIDDHKLSKLIMNCLKKKCRRVENDLFPELVLNLVWSGIKSGLLLMPTVYLQWPTCFTIPIKVEVLEFIPRAGLRAFEKKVSRATIELGVVLGEKTWKPTPKTGRGARNWRQRRQIILLKQRYPFRGRPQLCYTFFFFPLSVTSHRLNPILIERFSWTFSSSQVIFHDKNIISSIKHRS